MSRFLGIDIGTSSVMAVLIDEEQTVCARASAPLTVSRPKPGWSEQAPEAWWAAVESCLDELAAQSPSALGEVEAIGLSGQMHGATLLDGADKPLRPCILWNDGRAAAQCGLFESRCPQSLEIAGNRAMPGFTAPKLLWVRDNEPDVFRRTACVLLPKDYIRLCLTGGKVSEMSDASGTLWLDVGKRDWSGALLAASDLSRDQMPSLVEGTQPSGRLRKALADRWGMKLRPVVAGGAGDNAASACGLGVVRPGDGFVSLGTSGVLFVASDRFSPNPEGGVHAFCHALPGAWHEMGVILSAAASLEWLAAILGASPAELVGELGEALQAPSPIHFLPYLSGERTPHNDAEVRGGFFGLSHGMARKELTRAVLQGVTFALMDCHEALRRPETPIGRLYAVGGGSRSRLWLQMIATTLGLPVAVPLNSEIGAALGAARLGIAAARGAGIGHEEIFAAPRLRETIEPDRALAPAYQEAWGRYRRLYPLMKEALTA